MYQDTNAPSEVFELTSARRTRRSRTKKRTVNWQSANRGRTSKLQEQIHGWLNIIGEGFSVSELAGLVGISRQLCLYHLKKMAATRQLVMALEPCEGNGGLQFHVWANGVAAAHFLARVAA